MGVCGAEKSLAESCFWASVIFREKDTDFRCFPRFSKNSKLVHQEDGFAPSEFGNDNRIRKAAFGGKMFSDQDMYAVMHFMCSSAISVPYRQRRCMPFFLVPMQHMVHGSSQGGQYELQGTVRSSPCHHSAVDDDRPDDSGFLSYRVYVHSKPSKTMLQVSTW